MLRRVKRIMYIVLCVGTLHLLTDIRDTEGSSLSGKSRELVVGNAEIYLNSISSLSGKFLQRSGSEERSGEIHMLRPGYLLMRYTGGKLDIHSDGKYLIYVDHELQEATHFPLSSTPAHFFLSRLIKINDKDILVKNVEEVEVEGGGKIIQLDLVDRKTNERDSNSGREIGGMLRIYLSNRPMKLLGWRVVESGGGWTDVFLQDTKFGVPLDKKIFKYDEIYAKNYTTESRQ